TLEELRDEVRANLRRDSTALTDERIDRFINWAIRGIASFYTFEEMRTTSTTATEADVKSYSFPTNMKDIFTIRLIDGASSRKLIYVHPREFDTLIPYPEQNTTGRSRWYVDYGSSFELYPIPDDTYSLQMRISEYPSELSANSDTPDLVGKDELIVAEATLIGWQHLREDTEVTFWRKRRQELMLQAIRSDHSAEDWVAVARPFTIHSRMVNYKNPFTGMGL
ncbi:MAG: phage adaptor protein, partial [Methermicoccaceae archaeon]